MHNGEERDFRAKEKQGNVEEENKTPRNLLKKEKKEMSHSMGSMPDNTEYQPVRMRGSVRLREEFLDVVFAERHSDHRLSLVHSSSPSMTIKKYGI